MAYAIRIREGVVDRLRESRGIKSEEAFAERMDTDRKTLRRIVNGAQPSGAFIANFCAAYGLGMGEAFEIVDLAPIGRVEKPARTETAVLS
ncbi:MAG: oxidoreductase [Microbacterium sp.]|jgi:transcriptional regulator with XRE-family HTH domain|nr:oxidoreductase [Microbacterium sp.]